MTHNVSQYRPVTIAVPPPVKPSPSTVIHTGMTFDKNTEDAADNSDGSSENTEQLTVS